MKKYFIVMGIGLATIVCLNINLQWNTSDQNKLDITLENIEAMADGENQDVSCRLLGSLDCPKTNIKVKYIL